MYMTDPLQVCYVLSIVVSRSGRRTSKLTLELYGFTVRQELPIISIPLHGPDPDVPIELKEVFRRTYRAGPYRKVPRYDAAADPPLAPSDWDWARSVVVSRGVAPR